MNKARLLKLAEFLKTVSPKHFHMNSFSDCVGSDEPFNIKACGSTACALGWATQIPSFKRAGFRQRNEDSFEPVFQGQTGFSAAGNFFDIPEDDAIGLFGTDVTARTPKAVARSIIRFVRGHS